MKKSRFTEEQIVAILREAAHTTEAEAARKYEISKATLHVYDVKRLKTLELENSRLKKLLAEREQNIEITSGRSTQKKCARGLGVSNWPSCAHEA